MDYLRLNIQLAIPLSGDAPVGATPQDILPLLPIEIGNNLPALVREIRRAKKYAVKINAGQPNEEMTVIGKWHICGHEKGQACDEQEI